MYFCTSREIADVFYGMNPSLAKVSSLNAGSSAEPG
jgi:hypothetical protein